MLPSQSKIRVPRPFLISPLSLSSLFFLVAMRFFCSLSNLFSPTESSSTLSSDTINSIKDVLLQCDDVDLEKTLLALLSSFGVKGALCRSKYTSSRAGGGRRKCVRYCNTCFWYLCSVCATSCHTGHIVRDVEPHENPTFER